MAKRNDIVAIRERLDSHLGQRVTVRASEGRKRIVVKEGVLERTYPSIFVVRFEDDDARCASWSYVDVLTDVVELEFAASGND